MAINHFPIQTLPATASNVAYVPTGNITATNVQAAIAQITGRAYLTGTSKTYYVSPSGNDTTGDGSVGSPWKTPQFAANKVSTYYDAGETNLSDGVTIKLADGTYTPSTFGNAVIFPVGIVGGYLNIVGNVSTPANVIFDVQGQKGFLFGAPMFTQVSGIKFIDSIGGGVGISMNGPGSFTGIGNVDFGQIAGGNHISCEVNSVIYCTNSSYTISGGADQHIYSADGGVVDWEDSTITLTGTPNFTGQFVKSELRGVVFAFGMTFVGSATGKKFLVSKGGLIHTAHTDDAGLAVLPGDVAGTGFGGGVYDGTVLNSDRITVNNLSSTVYVPATAIDGARGQLQLAFDARFPPWNATYWAYGNADPGCSFAYVKTKGANIDTHAAVANTNVLMSHGTYASDGAAYIPSATMNFVVDGAVSAGVVPVAFTITSGTGSYGTERFRIGSNGLVVFGSAIKIQAASALVNAANDGAAASGGVVVGQMYRNGSILMVRVA